MQSVVTASCVNIYKGICGQTGAGYAKNALSIVPVRVKAKSSYKYTYTYAFLDSGSTDTFCADSLVSRLNINGKATQIMLSTLTQSELVKSTIIQGLEVYDLEGKNAIEIPKAYTQSKLPVGRADIPTQEEVEKWPHLRQIPLPRIDAEIELLIGNNVPRALEPWQVINSEGNGPYAVRTRLGWIVNGPTEWSSTPNRVCVNRISVTTDLERQMANYYDMDYNERITEDEPQKSREDIVFMKRVADSIKLKNGHYEVGLPFRDVDQHLPDNKAQTVQCAAGLKRRLEKNTKFREDYKSFMSSIIEQGYAEEVPAEDRERNDGMVRYIPHHGVYHPKKKKMHVVFNCAARYQGISINDTLLQGPDLTNTLVGVLLRFRQEPTAFVTDIHSMFYQVTIPQHQHDMLRFLWWPNGDTTQPLKQYRMTVHVFGATSSPSCANYALRRTAEDNAKAFGPEVESTIRNNFYVDDCLKSVATEQEATTLVRNLRQACAKGGFHLNKWASNSQMVLKDIPREERATEPKDLNMDRDSSFVEGALGVQWNIHSDKFEFHISVKENPCTRRGILSTTSSIYDPLGFLGPFLLTPKMLLQDLCRLKLPWHEEIPEQHKAQWQRWLIDLSTIADFKVTRCLKPSDFGEVIDTQVHHFADASESGYGTGAYLRLENRTGRVHCAFIIGKARVAPLKQINIPRMELTAATVAVHVNKLIQRELELKIDSVRYWTDSTSVLKYIRNNTTRFHTFVANRLAVIHDGSDVSEWNSVNSALNPADDASRGLDAHCFLSNPRWIRGPEFLWQPQTEWPTDPGDCKGIARDDPEVKQVITVAAVCYDGMQADYGMNRLLNYYSSWNRLKRCIAWFIRLQKLLRNKAKERERLPVRALRTRTKRTLRKAETKAGQVTKPTELTVRDLD